MSSIKYERVHLYYSFGGIRHSGRRDVVLTWRDLLDLMAVTNASKEVSFL
jgi:hypothetical protein